MTMCYGDELIDLATCTCSDETIECPAHEGSDEDDLYVYA